MRLSFQGFSATLHSNWLLSSLPNSGAINSNARNSRLAGTCALAHALDMPDDPVPFWRSKSLEAMSPKEWESLCDGCGRCCLLKLEDEDDGTLHHTDVACRLFDGTTCRCRDYANRASKVPDCITLTPEQVRTLRWLPPSCGYRLIAEGKDLSWWHPLVSGTQQTVIDAGVSVRGRVFATEDEVSLAKLQTRIRKWPNNTPKSDEMPPKEA
jgi:uncharacterized protein